jgi:hypothetical protein
VWLAIFLCKPLSGQSRHIAWARTANDYLPAAIVHPPGDLQLGRLWQGDDRFKRLWFDGLDGESLRFGRAILKPAMAENRKTFSNS